MSYLGENDLLSFRDNFCEVLPNKNFTSANAADFGISLPAKFGSIAVGCADEKIRHILFALCSGIADSGREEMRISAKMPIYRRLSMAFQL